MRKLALILDGVRYPLNRENGLLLHNVTGLGTVNAYTFSGITNTGFYAATSKDIAQAQVVGELVFVSSAYTRYAAFADALLKASSLVLCYDPNGTEYRADVELSYLTKTELTGGAFLSVPVAFHLCGLWYTEETLTGTGSVSVSAGGQAETGVKVRVTASVADPDLTLVSDGVTVARAKLLYTTMGVFEYSNYPDDSHIYDGGTDIIRYVDTAYNVYGRTRNAFTVTLSGAAMTVTVRKYWRTV